MFKLEGFIEDKNLPKVLHLLDGLILDLRTVPVRNAVKQGGKIKSTAANSTGEAIAAYARAAKLHVITTMQIKEALGQSGYSVGGSSTAIRNAVESKLLKRGKGRGQYVVVENKQG